MPGPFAPRSPEQRTARQAARTAPGLVGGKVPSVGPVQIRRAQDRTQPPAADGGAAGASGWAEYRADFSAGLVSGAGFIAPSGITLHSSAGVHGSSIASTAIVTSDGVYAITATLQVTSTDASPGDLSSVEYAALDMRLVLGTVPSQMCITNTYVTRGGGTGFHGPGFDIATSSGALNYTVLFDTVYISVIRWDLP